METAYVLRTAYAVPRPQIVDILIDLLGRGNVEIWELSKPDAVQALLLCRPSNRVSFADALIWAAARNSADARIYTFDRRFPDQEIERVVLG